MFRPSSLRPTPIQRALGRNLALDLVAAIGVGVTSALIGALLPTIARREGLEPIGLSALAAAPFVANLLGAFAGRFGPRSTNQLAAVRGLGAIALIALFLVPSPPVMVIVATVFWISLSFGAPFHLRLWAGMYPARLVGRLVGVIGMGRAAAGALAAFGGGVIADRLGGPSAVAIAGVVGLAATLAYLGLRAPSAGRPPVYSARDSFRSLGRLPVLRRITIAQGFYGGGIIAATPLFAFVHVDRLDLTLGDVGVLGVITAVSTTVAFLGWGPVTDRLGSVAVLRLGSPFGAAALLAYAVAPDLAFLWFAAVATGIATAAIDVAFSAAMIEHAPPADRSPATAGLNAVTGARGIVAAFLMSALLQAGLVDVMSGLLLCASTSAIGVLVYIRAVPSGRPNARVTKATPVPAVPATAEVAAAADPVPTVDAPAVPAAPATPAGVPAPATPPASAADRPAVVESPAA